MDYDPMLSKLIVHAPTRQLAIARMLRALDEYVIGGSRTNLGLFRRILDDPGFQAGRLDTGYLDRLLAGGPIPPRGGVVPNGQLPDRALAAIAAGVFRQLNGSSPASTASPEVNAGSAWKQLGRREGLRS